MATKNEQFMSFAFQATKNSIQKLEGNPLPCCYQIISEHSVIEVPKGAELVSMFGGKKLEGTFYEMDATPLNSDLVNKTPQEWADIIKDKVGDKEKAIGYTLWGLLELDDIDLYGLDDTRSSFKGTNLFLIMHQIGEDPSCFLMKDGWNQNPSKTSRLEPKLMSLIMGWSDFPVPS